MPHARRCSPWFVAAGTLVMAVVAPAPARPQNATRACEAAIQNEAGAFVQRRSNPIESCLRAILACREKAKPAQAAACRAKLVLPDTGACAVGTLDAGVSTLGTGAAAIAVEDAGGLDKLSTALRTMVAGLETDCFAEPSVDLAAGLGFTPAPEDARALADRLNRVPGGLGCLANSEVGITTPLASTLIAEVAPYDGHCVAADLPGDLYQKFCSTDAECGPVSGRCGQLAYVLKEGGPGLTRCESCMPGSSRVGGGCQHCFPGRYSDALDAASCTACEPGSFSNVYGATSCSACPVGSFQPYEDKIACAFCLPGTFTDQMGSTSCADCQAGTFSEPGASQCTSCSAGTFSGPGAETCKHCRAGEYSGRGASSCTQCAPGRYSDAGSAECSLCPAGRYSKGAGSASCAACAVGTFAASPGTTSCVDCPAGHISAVTGATQCSACPAGTYAAPRSAACVTCSANSISGGAAGSCTACPANSAANAARTACLCSVGFYRQDGTTQCVACTPGMACAGGEIVLGASPGFWTPATQP